jgi:hypothetical protein
MSDACGEKEKEREHGKNAQRVTLKENLHKGIANYRHTSSMQF